MLFKLLVAIMSLFESTARSYHPLEIQTERINLTPPTTTSQADPEQSGFRITVGESGEYFWVDREGYVYYLNNKLFPPLDLQVSPQQREPIIVFISPLSPSGRYAILRVFGYKAPAAVIDTEQNQLFDTVNPLAFDPWIAWTQQENYGFILHPDDGGGFSSILRIDLRDGRVQSWHGIDLLTNPNQQYYTLDEQTFTIEEGDRQFSIHLNIYPDRSTSALQEQVRVTVDIETMATSTTSIVE